MKNLLYLLLMLCIWGVAVATINYYNSNAEMNVAIKESQMLDIQIKQIQIDNYKKGEK